MAKSQDKAEVADSGQDSAAQSGKASSIRQAVVVIHGMGEQRPMETLRWFVDGVLPGRGRREQGKDGALNSDATDSGPLLVSKAGDGTNADEHHRPALADLVFGANPGKSNEDYWIVPDGRTGSHELSRIRARPVKNGDGPTIRSDFYELYYADELTNNTLQHLLGWVQGLMFRWPHQLPKRQFWLWFLLWLIAVFSIVLLGPELANSPFKRLVEFFKSGDGRQGLWAGLLSTLGGLAGVWYSVAKVRLHVDHHGKEISNETFSPKMSFALAIIGPVLLAFFAYYLLPWNAMGPGPIALKAAAEAGWLLYPFVLLWYWPLMKIGVAALLYAVIYQFGVPVFGDVARYVRATPSSIGSREKIRLRGLGLLTALHDAKVKDEFGNDKDDHEYDRIVIAAHSLGSIVAMDVLRLFWAQRGPGQDKDLDTPSINALQAVDTYCEIKSGNKARLDSSLDLSVEGTEKDFFSLQRKASKSLAGGNSKWRITDFLTMGSPLAHSEFLIARDPPRLAQMIRERIIPQCPPILEMPGKSNNGKWSFMYTPSKGGGARPHHAAMFACIRWTALYDPRRWQFFGDFIAGPLKRDFGPGIAEVPVKIKRGGGLLPRLVTHNDYWNPKASGKLVDSLGSRRISATEAKLPSDLKHLAESEFVHIDALRAILFPEKL